IDLRLVVLEGERVLRSLGGRRLGLRELTGVGLRGRLCGGDRLLLLHLRPQRDGLLRLVATGDGEQGDEGGENLLLHGDVVLRGREGISRAPEHIATGVPNLLPDGWRGCRVCRTAVEQPPPWS